MSTAAPLRILLLTHAFNGLAQRLLIALRAQGHAVTVELDIADAVTLEAIALWKPDLLIAPFLKRRLPESVWQACVCLVVHPGPPGDRGPSALDWAVLQAQPRWGVTVLQAVAEVDAGPVWASAGFDVRPAATKSSLYRREVTQAAMAATLAAVARCVPGQSAPAPIAAGAAVAAVPAAQPRWQPLVTREQRVVDWQAHASAEVLRRVRSADGAPGAVARLMGRDCRLYDLHPAGTDTLSRLRAEIVGAAPGQLLARRGPALLVATLDAALWVGHVRLIDAAGQTSALKLPATLALAELAAAVPEWPVPLSRPDDEWDELRLRMFGPSGARVGWLEMDFHNGAMSERQCRRLQAALREVRTFDLPVLVLAGGADFFSNGIHLHDIEAAAHREGDSAADASMRNIEAMDDVVLELLTMTDRLTVSALRGSAGAGGCFLALAADQVWAHDGTVLNPHYKNMGNLYGSEYWTYVLPKRVGAQQARSLMQQRLPLDGPAARAAGLIDACFASGAADFEAQALQRALALAASPDLAQAITAKAQQRAADESARPLAAYRADELAQMQRNFYGFDPSYHVARHHFVHRKPHAFTPRHLAVHR
jgi:putative two-component system hydrogenase maturation factor HypX/HoxX